MSDTTVFPKTGTPNNPLADFAALFFLNNLGATVTFLREDY